MYSGLTYACWRSVAIDDIYVRLQGRLRNPSYRIVLKIRLVDCTLGSRNFAASHDACAEDCGTLELGAGRLRIYDQASIHNRIDTRDPHLTLIIDLDFNNRGHV